MKKIGLYAFTIFILLLSVTACNPATTIVTTQTDTVTKTISEITWLDLPTYNGFWSEIKVDVGDVFAINLYRQPRLGLDWFVSYDENLLTLLASEYKNYSTGLIGTGGDQYFIFKGLQQGHTQLNFKYRHTYPEADIVEEEVFNVAISSTNPPIVDSISPSLGVYLPNKQEVSSEALLKSIQIDEGISEEEYFSPGYPSGTVHVGEPIIIVKGTIQNKHKENTWIHMWAEGYNEMGVQVSWTLDYAALAGFILTNLETDETGEFVIHLNYSTDIRSIHIYGNNYSVHPP